MSRYIKKVRSSVKKGVDVELSMRTVLVGPNGSGKTSVIQSAELATRGWASDMEGRARVRQHGTLARLFSDGTPKFAEAVFDDGTTCTWRMEEGTKKGTNKKPEQEAPILVEWPVQELIDTLQGDASTVQAWLEKEVIGSIVSSDVLKAVPLNTQEIVKDLMAEKGLSDFLSLAKAARSKAKALRSNATRSEKTVDSMTQGIPAPLLSSERTELEEKLNQLVRVRGVTQDEYDRSVEALKAKADAFSSLKVEETEALDTSAAQKVMFAIRQIEEHVKVFGSDSCWVCGTEGVNLVQQLQSLQQASAALAPMMQKEAERRASVSRRDRLWDELQRDAEALKSKVVVPDTTEERNRITSILAADSSAQRAWRNAAAAKAEAGVMRSTATSLIEAATALEKAGRSLLKRKKESFEKAVSSFLPASEQFGVDLKSSRVGIVRENRLHSALSDSERIRVLLALSSLKEDQGVPHILAPEDRAWDAETLSRTMAALSKSSSQIILMSTVEPEPCEGWTCVHV